MNAELTPCWRFRYEGLAGHVHGGQDHGIEMAEGVGGARVTRRKCMNLEHYYAKDRSDGRFVPRRNADVNTQHTEDGAIVVGISTSDTWDVTASIAYRFLPERIVEARFDFTFGAPYRDFEAFISNYFGAPAEPYVHIGGKWTQQTLSDREHRYWARSDRDAEVIHDGRLDAFLNENNGDYEVPVDELRYDYPIMITPIGDSGWSVIHVVEREACPSISANRTWMAHDFSLIGRDVSAGERVSCRAWMAYVQLATMDDAIVLHDELTKCVD